MISGPNQVEIGSKSGPNPIQVWAEGFERVGAGEVGPGKKVPVAPRKLSTLVICDSPFESQIAIAPNSDSPYPLINGVEVHPLIKRWGSKTLCNNEVLARPPLGHFGPEKKKKKLTLPPPPQKLLRGHPPSPLPAPPPPVGDTPPL